MATWSDEAKQYLEGYLWQVTALLQVPTEPKAAQVDALETVEDLRQHIIHKAEETAGSIVTLADIQTALGVVGTPEQVVGAGRLWADKTPAEGSSAAESPVRRLLLGTGLSSLPWAKIAITALVVAVVCLGGLVMRQGPARVAELQGSLSQGWFQAGTNHVDYATGLAHGLKGHAGQPMFIRSESAQPSGFCTVMAETPADAFRGQQVTLHSTITSRDTGGLGGLWLRIDDAAGKPLGFDNMHDRPIRGSVVGPNLYTVRLNVPATAAKIAYGVLLEGRGHLWFDTPDLVASR